MKPSAPLIHEDRNKYKNTPKLPEGMSGHNLQSYVRWKNGDVEAGFAQAARVFEHTFRTPLSHHGYIEPCACTVQVHANGQVEVWASNKGPWGLREQMAEDFGVSQEKIKVHIVHVGGDFGAKASLIDVPIAYYLAKAVGGRPVKLVLDYNEEILIGGHRHPSVITVKTRRRRRWHSAGGEKRYLFQRRRLRIAEGQSASHRAWRAAFGEHVPLSGHRCADFCSYTNQVPCTQTRTPGSPQVVFAFESHMDIIAKEMGIDALELRRKNILHDGDANPMGEKWSHILMGEVLERIVKTSGWKKGGARRIAAGAWRSTIAARRKAKRARR